MIAYYIAQYRIMECIEREKMFSLCRILNIRIIYSLLVPIAFIDDFSLICSLSIIVCVGCYNIGKINKECISCIRTKPNKINLATMIQISRLKSFRNWYNLRINWINFIIYRRPIKNSNASINYVYDKYKCTANS